MGVFIRMKLDLKDRMIKARKDAGYSQKNMAPLLDISIQTLNRYENGHRTPNGELLNQMAELTGCHPGWLLTGHPPTSPDSRPKTVQKPKGLMTESQKDQMIETQGKLIKSLEAKIEELEGSRSEKKESQRRQKK